MSKKSIPWEVAREELLSSPEARAAYEAELANPTDDFEIAPVPEEELEAALRDTNPRLLALLKGVTEENRHDPVDWGAPVGKELL